MDSSFECPDEYANFSESTCQCSNNGRSQVRSVRWIKVPATHSAMLQACQLFFLGLALFSSEARGSANELASHDCIEIRFVCNNCKKEARWTSEFAPEGKSLLKGYYNKRIDKVNCFKPPRLNLNDVQRCFRFIRPGSYDLVNNNGKKFAKELYFRLEELAMRKLCTCHLL